MQAKARERGQTTTTDEFAADAVARIIARLVNRHGNSPLPQRDAQRQPRKPAADNRYRFCRRHDSVYFSGNEQMAERANGVFRELPVVFIRPERGKFIAGKTGAHAHNRIVARHVVAAN